MSTPNFGPIQISAKVSFCSNQYWSQGQNCENQYPRKNLASECKLLKIKYFSLIDWLKDYETSIITVSEFRQCQNIE